MEGWKCVSPPGAVIGIGGLQSLATTGQNVVPVGAAAPRDRRHPDAVVDLEGASDAEPHRLKLLSIPSGEW